MHFLTICLLVFGVSGLTRTSGEDSAGLEDSSYVSAEIDDDSQESSVEDFQDAEEDFEESSDEYQEYSSDDYEDASDTEDSPEMEAFREELREAFKIWNAAVKSCEGDEACLAAVNNVIRPLVNEAADKRVIAVIDPCEDRVGTYELETADGWTIEAVLPC